MAIKLPDRNYFTFPELMKRWDCEEADIFHLLLSEKLIPSYFFSDDLKVFDLQDEQRHQQEDPFGEVPMVPKVLMTHEFLYLIKPMQVAHDMILFDVISPTRTGQPDSFMKPVRLREHQFSFKKILVDGVVMMSEVALFEGDARKPSDAQIHDIVLNTSERNTLLKLVIGMAVKGYGHDPAASKSTAPKEIADDLAALGISVTDDTVRKYLKKAAGAVLPASQRQP